MNRLNILDKILHTKYKKYEKIENQYQNKHTQSKNSRKDYDLKVPRKILWIFTILFIIVIVNVLIFRNSHGLEITFLDVSQGESICIKTAYNSVFLIDGGSSDVSKVGTYRIAPYLKASGINRIKGIFVTHMDMDHISGILEILDPVNQIGIQVDNVILPDVAARDIEFLEIINLAEEMKISVTYMKAGDIYQEGDLFFTCLHPVTGYEFTNTNGYSLVLSLRYKEFDMLLTGDIEGEGEYAVSQVIDHSYEVLKVAHHGSKNSTDRFFLEKVKPEIAIISSGKNNRYGHPHEELIERLKEQEVNYYNTSIYGSITIKTNGKKYSLKTYIDNKAGI